jgi:competence protein ComEC
LIVIFNELVSAFTLKIWFYFFVVVDSSGVYLSEGQGNIVLLTGSPDIHLGKLIQKLKPKQIVVDGNNYKSYVERWRETSQKYKISFYNTYEKGALSFNLHE